MQVLPIGLASLLSAIPEASATNHSGILSAHFDPILGSSTDLKIIANTFELAEKAEKIVLDEIDRLSKILGSFDSSTEFSLWQKTMHEAIPISEELHTVLKSFDVWNEDEDHKPVRRIALWYNIPRWLPDLRSWYAAQRASEIDVTSITVATRSAGNYSLVWDGKDDAGQFVNQGKYTVFVEAAREHGTYQLMSIGFQKKYRSKK